VYFVILPCCMLLNEKIGEIECGLEEIESEYLGRFESWSLNS
jgi:hypothetical protein